MVGVGGGVGAVVDEALLLRLLLRTPARGVRGGGGVALLQLQRHRPWAHLLSAGGQEEEEKEEEEEVTDAGDGGGDAALLGGGRGGGEECGELLLGDAHVVAGVGLAEDVARARVELDRAARPLLLDPHQRHAEPAPSASPGSRKEGEWGSGTCDGRGRRRK